MKRQNTPKKVPLCSSQVNYSSEIEKKVDEILNAHSEVLRRGRERKTSSEDSYSFERKPQLLFFTKNKSKIKPVKQIKNEDKPTNKQTQNQQKTQYQKRNSQGSHSKTLDYGEKNTEKNLSRPQKNILNQKITHFTQKIQQPSSHPPHQYFTIPKNLNQKEENKRASAPQVKKEPMNFEAKKREQEARRLAKEREKKVQLEKLELQRKAKEEVLRKKLAEKQAKEEVNARAREAKRVAKEHEEKLRLERIAIEKEKQEEQKRKELEKKELIAEAKEKQREEKRLIKEREKKVQLEKLELQRKAKEEVLRKKLAEKQAKEEVKARAREAKRVAKEHEEKLRLERIAIEKEKQEEQKRKELEKKELIAEAKEKQREEKRLIKEREKKVQLEKLELQRKAKEEVLRKKLAEKQAKEEVKARAREAKRVAKEHEEKLRLERIAIEKEKQEEQKRKELEKKELIAEAKEKQREEQTLQKLEKEKTQAPVEPQRHFGFRNTKKEGETTKAKFVTEKKITTSEPVHQHSQETFRQQLGEELQRARLDRRQVQKSSKDADRRDADSVTNNQEAPLVFEDLVAQVKPEESTWLDEKIKSEKIEEDNTKNTLREDSDKVFFDEKSFITDLSAKSVFESPDLAQNLKQNTFNEILPDGTIQNSDIANKLKAFTLEHLGYSQNTIEEIDFYSLQEPFAYVNIIREKESLDKRYVLIEMGLSEEEARYLKFIKETLEELSFNTDDLEVKGDSQYLSEKVDSIISEYMLNIDALSKEKIMHYLEAEAIGLGRLEVLMKDPNIEDISCDGSGVFLFLYHRKYGSLKSNIMFNDDDELSDFVVKLAQKCGKHISISEPMLDATMPDGSRIQMTLSTEVTTKGSTFTIRKFSQNPFSPPDLVEFHTMSSEMVAYMWLAVENGINALIAGGTAAGKTSTLNAICLFIPREKKIVSIEETREINLPHPNWIPGVVRTGFGEVVGNKVIGEIDLYDLMKAALRQRPEYILVGEIRGKEAYVLFQAMATGHTTYSTVHADSAQSLIHRLEGKPIEIPRIMLQSLDIVCIQVISRVKNKRARRVKQIIEIIDIDPTTKEILTNEVFTWNPIEDQFIYSGKSYIIERIRAEKNIGREDMIKEIKNRTILLDWMNKNNIREFKKVATLVARYVDNPEDVMKQIGNNS